MNRKLMIITFCIITVLSLTIVSATDTNDSQISVEKHNNNNEIVQEETNTFQVSNVEEFENIVTNLNQVKNNQTSTINMKTGTYETNFEWNNNQVKLDLNGNNCKLSNSNITINENTTVIINSAVFDGFSMINNGNLIITNSTFTSEDYNNISLSNNGHLLLENCIFKGLMFNALEIHNDNFMSMNNCTFIDIFRITYLIKNNNKLIINGSYFNTTCDLTSTSEPIIFNNAKLLIKNSQFDDELNSFISDNNQYESLKEYTYSELVIINSTLNQRISQYADWTNYINNVKITLANSTFNSIYKKLDGMSVYTDDEAYAASHAIICGEDIDIINNYFKNSRIIFRHANFGNICNINSVNNECDQDTFTVESGRKFNATDIIDINNKKIENSNNIDTQQINNYINTFPNNKQQSVKTDKVNLKFTVKVNDNIIETKNVKNNYEVYDDTIEDYINSFKGITVKTNDKITIEIEITDSNNKSLSNKNIIILHDVNNEEIIITSDTNGKCSYSFKAVYYNEKEDFYTDYAYNDRIIIVLPHDSLIRNTTRIIGTNLELFINIENNTEDNTTENNEIKNSTDKTLNNQKTQKNTKNTRKIHSKIINHSNKVIKTMTQKNFLKMITLEDNFNVTLSWLESFFNKQFANKTLLIYIDDTLVYNGTISDNSTEILFKIVKGYKGEHVLKVVEGENVYQREFI